MENKRINYAEEVEKIATYDRINSVGLIELGKKIKAMTYEEKRVVAMNLPIDIMLEVIGKEVARYQELEAAVSGLVARFEK